MTSPRERRKKRKHKNVEKTNDENDGDINDTDDNKHSIEERKTWDSQDACVLLIRGNRQWNDKNYTLARKLFCDYFDRYAQWDQHAKACTYPYQGNELYIYSYCAYAACCAADERVINGKQKAAEIMDILLQLPNLSNWFRGSIALWRKDINHFVREPNHWTFGVNQYVIKSEYAKLRTPKCKVLTEPPFKKRRIG